MGQTEKKKVVVIGAGVTGLAAAYRLSKNPQYEVHVIDKEPVVGGLCRSFTDGEFILDHGPHKFYTLIDGIVDELNDLMGDELLEPEKTQKLHMCEKYFTFPLKMTEMMVRFPPTKTVGILASFAKEIAKKPFTKEEAETYEAFIIEKFGKGLYKQIFEPLARKIYGEPSRLDRKLAEVRISSPGLVAVIKNLVCPSNIDRTVSAPKFHYPKEGYGRIPERLKEVSVKNGCIFHLGATLMKLETKLGKVSEAVFKDSQGVAQKIDCDQVVYTIPPSVLPALIDNAPKEIEAACRETRFRHTVIYYYLLKSKSVLPAMWVFYPESKFRFGRLSEMGKFSPHTTPKDHTALMVDFTCDDEDPTWEMDDSKLGNLLSSQLKPLKLFEDQQVVKRFSKRFRNVYPVYGVGFQKAIDSIRTLEKQYQNLFFIGRLGDFNYNNADQCLDMGFQAADQITRHGNSGETWQALRSERFQKYKIVD